RKTIRQSLPPALARRSGGRRAGSETGSVEQRAGLARKNQGEWFGPDEVGRCRSAGRGGPRERPGGQRSEGRRRSALRHGGLRGRRWIGSRGSRRGRRVY